MYKVSESTQYIYMYNIMNIQKQENMNEYNVKSYHNIIKADTKVTY